MSVDFGSFELAAPPGTGVDWVLKECKRVGLRLQNTSNVFDPFLTDKFRVSLVCHPCRWLNNLFDMIASETLTANVFLMYFLVLVDGDDFDVFVRNYLEYMSGAVGKLFDTYKCDARMRIEDMPWALIEFLESLGVPEEKLNLVSDPGKEFVSDRRWDEQLFQQVVEAESELCLMFDYY